MFKHQHKHYNDKKGKKLGMEIPHTPHNGIRRSQTQSNISGSDITTPTVPGNIPPTRAKLEDFHNYSATGTYGDQHADTIPILGELLMSRATSKDITIHLGVHPIEQETHRFRTNGFTTSKLGRALLEITHTARITHPTPRRRHPKPYHHPRRRPKRQGKSHPNKQGVTDLLYGSPPRNRRTFPYHQT